MEGYCPFLETEPRRQGDWPYRCAIGVNFYSVGPERELCRICPIDHLGDALLCEYLDVYTFLQVNRARKRSVQVEMECRLGADPLPDPVRCDICLEMMQGG